VSRIGKMPIPVPQGVTVTIDVNKVTVKGPKGELFRTFHPAMDVRLENGSVTVHRGSDEKEQRALHGLTRSLIANMVQGVSQGFQKTLEIVGLGYRAQAAGGKLVLQVGLSNNIELVPPPGIQFQAESATRVNVIGIDKERVGLEAAKIRALRPPDNYKGKGIRYAGEYVRLKPGKTAARKQ